MELNHFNIIFIFLIILSLVLLIIIQFKQNQNKIEKRLLEFLNKFDDYTDIQKIAYIFAEEARNLLNAEFVSVIEYSYSKTNILSSVPMKNIDKTFSSPHELYLILKNLEQENITHIKETDIQSEHFRQLFPLFEYENYHILPVYKDTSTIITLEIYGKLKTVSYLKKDVLKQVVAIFQKILLQQNKFKKQMQQSGKNEIIIKFLDRIRHTLDENILKQIILEEVCNDFKADRTYFITSNKNDLMKPLLGKEYLGNPYVKSLRGNNLDFSAVWKQLKENNMNPPVFVIEDSLKFIKQNKLEGTAIDTYLQKSRIKSSYPFLIYENSESYIYLVIQFTKAPYIFDKYDFEIMELISKQTNIALSQASLHTKLLQNSKKEKLLIDLTGILRSSFDLKKVASEFTSKVGTYFEADRCVIRFYNNKKNAFNGYDEAFEYKKYYYTPSTKNIDLQSELDRFLLQNEKFHDTLSIQYDDLNNENFEFKDSVIKYGDKYKIKSYLSSFIRYNGKLLGLLALHFHEKKIFNKNDEEFAKAIADQLGIAIYQSEMYKDIQSVAKKEKLLKEVFAETIGLQKKEQIYTYFSEKIMNLLNATGIVFVEFQENFSDNPKYYETYKKENLNLSKFKNHTEILNIIKEKTLYYNCNLNINNHNMDNFTPKTGTVCIGSIPVNNNILMLLFFDNKKEFNSFDKNILFSLTDVISQTIKDTLKTAEINNLRESFLSTLAHDLHIPLIAERNAISYLISKENLCEDKNTKEILAVLAETNKQTEDMLKALTSVYKYEANKKEISKENCNISEILDEALIKVKNNCDKKNITITKEIISDDLLFFGDYIEITKVIVIFLSLAIEESKENSEIFIMISDDNKYIKCCITSEGNSFREDLSKIVSNNNISTNSISQRVGEGIYLYLAKLIIKEHNGKIYINNKQGEGNIFCIELEKII